MVLQEQPQPSETGKICVKNGELLHVFIIIHLYYTMFCFVTNA